MFTSGRRVRPAFGLPWSDCLNSRLFVSKEVLSLEDSISGFRTRRRLLVIFAPHLPESSCEFVIERMGFWGRIVKILVLRVFQIQISVF